MAPAWKVGWVQALMGSNPIFSAVKKPQISLGLLSPFTTFRTLAVDISQFESGDDLAFEYFAGFNKTQSLIEA